MGLGSGEQATIASSIGCKFTSVANAGHAPPVISDPASMTSRSVAAYRRTNGRTHVLHCVDGLLRDLDVASGQSRSTGVAADEVVLTPRDKVLAILRADTLSLASLGADGRITPFAQRGHPLAGVRRLLAARVVGRNAVETLVTTPDETWLVVLPGGGMVERWPFVAPAAVGTEDRTLIWTSAPVVDHQYAHDRRVVPGGALLADAALVDRGTCIVSLSEKLIGVSWETSTGLERRTLKTSARTAAVVRTFGNCPEPVVAVLGEDSSPRLLRWCDLRSEAVGSTAAPEAVAADARTPSSVLPSAQMEDELRGGPVFVSYAHDDNDAVKHDRTERCCRPATEAARIVRQAELAGLASFWDRKIGSGQKWASEILNNLHGASTIVVIWGAGSVARWSRHKALRSTGKHPEGQIVEIEECASRVFAGIPMISVLLDGIRVEQLPPWMQSRQAVSLAVAEEMLTKHFLSITQSVRSR